jgi:biotin-dependent carboxylase-like uncharacterized protein
MQVSKSNNILRILDTGLGASLQDRGRHGWRRWGVPISGPMDRHSAACANRLLDNERGSPVIELLSQGAKFEVLENVWVAICGAATECSIPAWRAHRAAVGEIISVRHCRAGMWSYLAVEGGFAEDPIFGSASYYARANLGRKLEKNAILERQANTRFQLPGGVSGRVASWTDRWDFTQSPKIRVFPGPQWKSFSLADREVFLTESWKVSPRSDRVGYRLEGPTLKADPAEIDSEAVRLGSIQVPENGQPIITMPDGPTVGGYPKIALVDELDLPWVAQSRPGQSVRFQLLS